MTENRTRVNDVVVRIFESYAQNILVVIFGFLPIIFIPTEVAPFEYTKVFIVAFGIFVALVLLSLSILRSGAVTIGISYPLCALWTIVLFSGISSFLSGDSKDSFIGDLFSVHSTSFIVIFSLVVTIWVLLKPKKGTVMRLYIFLATSAIVLVAFHLSRLIFGSEFLSFNVFLGSASTPVGGWNDLALFLGLTVILSLITLNQLSLTRVGRALFTCVIILSLFMLGVINFFTIWIVLGVASLVMIVYSLGRDRFTSDQLALVNVQNTYAMSRISTLIVLVVSVLFIIGGATFGGLIAKYTNISYVEVRPSFETTITIAKNVYEENPFFGIGTNKFTDAWRLYKDTSINVTPFWNTDFNAGNGYITTFFVTTGVAGGFAWIIFILLYMVTGVHQLLIAPSGDKIWYFIGTSSFVSALYILGMSIVYVPGTVILLIGALCIGVSLSAFNVLSITEPRVVLIGTNRRTGFILTLGVIVIIIISMGALYTLGRHYFSVYVFNRSVLSMQQGVDMPSLEQQVERAYQLSVSDVFARRIAEFQFTKMNTLILRTEPTQEDQLEFQNASVIGVNAAQRAIRIDSNEPSNWSSLGSIYGLLAVTGVEGARERAVEAFTRSLELNPKNPLPYLELAVVFARTGETEKAYAYIEQAISLKQNFTEAFYLLSQLEIATGNVEGAIASTRSVIQLEPQNPARYYQLGVLESANGNISGAVAAFEAAVKIDQNYANAHYLLALGYDMQGKSDEAKKHLEVVHTLNPDNAEVTALIQVITTEGSLSRLRDGTENMVRESEPAIDKDGIVRTRNEYGTSLVSPVNTFPDIEDNVIKED